MRIAYVITRADAVGGATIHVRDLARAMRDRGHDTLVLVVVVVLAGAVVLFPSLALLFALVLRGRLDPGSAAGPGQPIVVLLEPTGLVALERVAPIHLVVPRDHDVVEVEVDRDAGHCWFGHALNLV